ncbi:MAG: M48 family metallopeptidase [Anaerolineales bacterium]|nr:MAG: M48 family metallopeptidase [Anaerolineales bacterium]
MPKFYHTSAYRYPNELLILALTLVLVALVIALTATATLCTSVVFIAGMLALSYSASRSRHQALMQRAVAVSPQSTPELNELVQGCQQRLQPGEVRVYLLPSKTLNAYTFGLDDPKVVVLYSALLKVMDADELRFIIGHEMGHVRLGHTRLNSLVGGMAGIPSSSAASALLALAFLGWNRACEYSADRAGLLACGKPEKAITALIKLVAGPQALTHAGMQLAYQYIDAQDDTFLGTLGEALGTHPMIIKRIGEIRRYAASAEYQRLLARLVQNEAV